MNSSSAPQIIGSLCAGLAGLVFLVPLQKLLLGFAGKHVNDDQWVPSALFALIPLWLLLMGALLCMTARGGFDWLRLGRPTQYGLTVAAAISLAAVNFVFVALYIRPGFTPRGLYSPFIYLVPLSTLLLAVLGLHPRLAAALPIGWVRLPWTIGAGISLIACAGYFGTMIVRSGVGGVTGFARRLRNPGPSSQEMLAQIAALDPERDFESLLWRAGSHRGSELREAANARLRSHPHFVDRLATELESGHLEPAVGFLMEATLSPAELAKLAKPARTGMEGWVNRIPAPNYTTKKHLKQLRHWGTEAFRVLTLKFANTGVDFGPVVEEFRDKVKPGK